MLYSNPLFWAKDISWVPGHCSQLQKTASLTVRETKDWLTWGYRGPASCQFRIAMKSHKRIQNAVLGCNLKNYRMISVRFQGKPLTITIIQIYVPTTRAKEAEVEWFYEDLLKLTPEKDVLFIIGDWDSKVGSQEIPGVTGKFGLGVQNEAGQRLIEFCQEKTHWSEQTPSSNNTRDDSTHGHHQMVNTEIRLITFFAAKDGEALYSQLK